MLSHGMDQLRGRTMMEVGVERRIWSIGRAASISRVVSNVDRKNLRPALQSYSEESKSESRRDPFSSCSSRATFTRNYFRSFLYLSEHFFIASTSSSLKGPPILSTIISPSSNSLPASSVFPCLHRISTKPRTEPRY
jgi:hypothetical protein